MWRSCLVVAAGLLVATQLAHGETTPFGPTQAPECSATATSCGDCELSSGVRMRHTLCASAMHTSDMHTSAMRRGGCAGQSPCSHLAHREAERQIFLTHDLLSNPKGLLWHTLCAHSPCWQMGHRRVVVGVAGSRRMSLQFGASRVPALSSPRRPTQHLAGMTSVLLKQRAGRVAFVDRAVRSIDRYPCHAGIDSRQ